MPSRPTITLLHTADIHLDSPLKSLALRSEGLRAQVRSATRTALVRMVDHALAEAVDGLLIAGDLYDGTARSAKTAAFLTAQLDRLDAAGIPVFMIKGNHDAENPITGEIALPPNVHVFDGRGGKRRLGETDVWIHGVSFSGRHAPDSLVPKFGEPVAGAVNIGMLHTSLAGAAGHDPYAPCSVADLAATGFDYWALGHVHGRTVHSEAPWIVMPGMPQGRDIGEAGPKSATLLTVGDGTIALAELPTSAVEFAALTVDVTGVEDEADLRGMLRARLAGAGAACGSDHAVLRVTLAGRTPLCWRIQRDRDYWSEALEGMAEEIGTVWIEKVAFALAEPDGEAGARRDAADAATELHRLMTEIRADDGFRARALAEVETMLALLPPDRRAALAPDADAAGTLVDTLATDGTARMMARMKGVAP